MVNGWVFKVTSLVVLLNCVIVSVSPSADTTSFAFDLKLVPSVCVPNLRPISFEYILVITDFNISESHLCACYFGWRWGIWE